MKSNTDNVHKLTEAVYKNLVENFNSGVRQILLTGKAYYKALQAVTVTAQAYNDALGRVGSAAKICRGGTEEIGEAILQITEAQKEIHNRFEDSTKALFTELILPLEQKLEKDFKKAHSDARKYTQEHKVVLSPYNKACESLKKFRKKTKNKLVYDNEKEAQHMRALGKCQEKLDQYRIQGLKLALLEERRCHCFLLQRLCAISQLKAAGHRHGVDVYSSLPEWQQIGSNPHILPPSADQLLMEYMDEPYEPMNGGPSYLSNGFLHRDGQESQSLSRSNEFRRSKSTHDIYRQANHFDGTKTLPPRTAAPLPPRSQVQAMYTFTAGLDNQLSFMDGDLITIMGENSDGWQYGQNSNTQKLGWFPLSFTQPVVNSSQDSPDFKLSPSQRYKSMGDLLDSRSLSEYTHQYEHDIPGNIRRPKSLYEGPQHGTSAPQLHSLYTGRDMSPHHTSSIYTSYGRPMQDSHQSAASSYSPQVSPPLPPPPSPPRFSSQHTTPHHNPYTTASQLQSRASTLPAQTTSVRSMMGAPPPPAPAAPPPAPPPPPPPVVTSKHDVPPPPPVPTPGTPGPKQPTYVSTASILSQQNAQLAGNPHMTGASRFGSPARQQPSQPPPPPPSSQRADIQDGEIEENVNYRSNPMFATVSLRQTKTNDRSAPKI
ncbi:brain-specific angiogenesis inhibitor 1-associated protein 2-like protein 2 isoform X2 [Mercenaria mercenaria]|uniref:brain-specific angiogenesis inhibitor 1-associated protein 2-like protein 2 isoform X2 n=1 Tax=Mercenaria mercenaria TaxID=6596 RepID=UPI00234F62B0|nr:brain-specific angiogenesis inhibitor 1-associated protein 2-like protein 2 isoform X2 [Mercenaria mercenaria]